MTGEEHDPSACAALQIGWRATDATLTAEWRDCWIHRYRKPLTTSGNQQTCEQDDAARVSGSQCSDGAAHRRRGSSRRPCRGCGYEVRGRHRARFPRTVTSTSSKREERDEPVVGEQRRRDCRTAILPVTQDDHDERTARDCVAAGDRSTRVAPGSMSSPDDPEWPAALQWP